MKIVHIANFYGPNSGGIKTTIHQLGNGYTIRGHQFIYIVPGVGFFQEGTPTGLKITVPSFHLPFTGGYRIIRSNRKLLALLATLNPERIEVSDRFTLSRIGLWAKQRKIPAVIFSHESLVGLATTYLPFSIRTIVDWHNRRSAKRFDHVITTTKYASQEFREINAKNILQIPLGVDLTTFSPGAADLELRKELLKGSQYLLVHCGRMSPEKQPHRSIEALREIRVRGIDARLIYIGIGPLWKQSRDASKDLPVTFLGYIADRHRVASILASADVSLAPGPIETFCLAALESIASGTPVVASQSSAVGEFLCLDSPTPAGAIAENNGVAFADKIEIFLTSPDQSRISMSCREQAEKYSWDDTIEALLELHGEKRVYKKTKQSA